jgi:uncharacterized membrane protein
MVDEGRIAALEARTAALEERIGRLDGARAAVLERPAPPPKPVQASTPTQPRPVRPPKPPREPISIEDLLGGRVLAWVGGGSVALGLVFLLSLAISRGWLGEEARCVMAFAASLLLVGAGVRLHATKGRTDASLAAACAGFAGLFASAGIASAMYGIVPAPLGVAVAIATGAGAVRLALSWRVPGVGALGILGGLAAPVIAGAEPTTGSMLVLAATTAAAAAILVHQRWTWLAVGSVAVTTPQWVDFLLQGQNAGSIVAVLSLFGAVNALTAVGFEARTSAPRVRTIAAWLFAFNALAVAAAGWFALEQTGAQGTWWLAALAAAHAVCGTACLLRRPPAEAVGLLGFTASVVLADVTFAAVADGLVLAVGWSAFAVTLLALVRDRVAEAPQRRMVLQLGVGAHLAIAIAHAVLIDAPAGQGGELPGALAVLAVAAGCIAGARLEHDQLLRKVFDGAGMAMVGYLGFVTLEGEWLALAWAAQAVTLARLARATEDEVAAGGALCFLGGAVVVAQTVVPPTAIIDGTGNAGAAALALGSVAGAAGALAWLHRGTPAGLWLAGTAAVAALDLASVELVTAFGAGTQAGPAVAGQLGPEQQAQLGLSVFWAIAGVGAVVAGLRRDRRELRLAGLALLCATIAKVFLYDLSQLESVYRVGSFIGLGVLLLAGAFAWQRARVRPVPDLREMPEGLR